MWLEISKGRDHLGPWRQGVWSYSHSALHSY